ncbi:unnamed protein product [Colletotrichum noveboracense]|uniref:Uncharacterized protein n=1 Tax=Colletotrichum noveboracense TaxID=2664923 RepID=A0A9W4RSD2_9PEZI|nr:hypothetical protein K456DRAFT_56377 [Colletotrichum gloeosporioides 23]CAI0647708.1 unnamed protein product [Colletotrichum noveboracense]
MHIYPTPISQPIGGLLGLAARQQDEEGVHVITQTIRRPATTFLTYVTLGPGDPTPVPGADIPETPVATTPTAEAPPPSRGSGSLSSAQIGAILGGIVGVVTILLIVCYCLMNRRPKPRHISYTGMYDDETTTTYSEYSVKTPPPRPPPPAFFPWNRRPARRSRRPPMPYPPYPTAPARPPFTVNEHEPWVVNEHGPRRTQKKGWQEPAVKFGPKRPRVKVNGPPRTERPAPNPYYQARWTQPDR